MIYGSVCSGLEAATAAWHSLGWKPAWFSEIEKFPSAVLAHHYPKTPNLGDMTRLHDHPKRSAIDLLVGGTPCQSFSVAGLRKGMDDARGNLALVFILLLRRTRARWVLWENVPGVLSSSGGKDLASFFGGLVGREIEIPEEGWGGAGIIEPSSPEDYGIAWRILDAQYFGVPQRRRRIFVVGYLGDWRPAAAVLLELHSVSGNPPPSREARKGTPARAESGADGGRRAVDGPCVAFTKGDYGQDCGEELSPTLRKGGVGGGQQPAIAFAPQAFYAEESRADNFPDPNMAPPLKVKQHVAVAGDVAGTLGANHGNIKAEHAWTGQLIPTEDASASVVYDARGRGDGEIVPTLCTDHAGRPSDYCPVVFDPNQVTNKANRSNPKPGDPCHTLPATSNSPVLFSLMPQNSGKDFKAREVDVAQPLMAAGPGGGNQGGDVIVAPQIFDPLNSKADDKCTSLGTNCGASTGRSIAFTQNQAGDVLSGEVFPSMGTNQNATGRNTPKIMTAAPDKPYVGYQSGGGVVRESGDITGTLDSARESRGTNQQRFLSNGMAVRRLTPRECERLQGFPDDYTLIPVGKKMAADGPRYKALGNSMAVPCMAWLGQRIEMVDALIRGLKK